MPRSTDIPNLMSQQDGTCVLLIDKLHCRCLIIKNSDFIEEDYVNNELGWKDRASIFISKFGRGTPDEKKAMDETTRIFIKRVVQKATKFMQKNKVAKLVLMCSDRDYAMAQKLMSGPVLKILSGHVKGNYINAGKNKIVEELAAVK